MQKKHFIFGHRHLGALGLLLFTLARAAHAVTLGWDANTSPTVAGYVLYYGAASGNYTTRTDVGTNTSVSVTGLAPGVTNYFAVTDYNGALMESAYSGEIAYVLPVVVPPIVALTAPAAGATYAAPATVNLAASVTANGHTITQVKFYNGATLLGTAANAPYNFSWSNVAAGSYSLTAAVVYDSGSTVSSPLVNITVGQSPPAVALTAPASGATYTAPAAVNLSASVTANGHTITQVKFYNGATLLGTAASAPYSFSWNNVAAGSYSLTAAVVYDSGSTVSSPLVNITVTTLPALPAPWQTADIGANLVAGSAGVSGGTYTVAGAGNLGGTADNFRFLYQTLSGNGQIQACLNSMQNTGVNGRIGVMIRETTTAGSRYAFMGLSPDDAFRWQRRSTTSGSTASTKSATGVPPQTWVRLVRTGNSLSGYSSPDGVNWTLVNSRNITMATNIYAGLVVASGTTNTLNTATFSNVTVVP